MSILKYFKWKHKDAALPLPDPVGPLSKDVPTSSIIEANNEVLKAIADQSTRKKKGPYEGSVTKPSDRRNLKFEFKFPKFQINFSKFQISA